MTLMRFFFGTVLLSFLLIMGCKKYTEGPGLTPWPVKTRITNTWTWDYCVKGVTNFTDVYQDSIIQFNKDFTFSICDTMGHCNSAKWNFTTHKQQLQLVYPDSAIAFTILRATTNELWLQRLVSGNASQTVRWELRTNGKKKLFPFNP